MGVFNLIVEKMNVKGLPDDGNLALDRPQPDLPRVLLRRLSCILSVPAAPPCKAVLDTGAPLTVFPHAIWSDQFGWRSGRHFDELPVSGVGAKLQGQVLEHSYSSTLVRLRVSVVLIGSNRERLELKGLVRKLADSGGPPFVLLGLWGGALWGRRLVVEPQPDSDELAARLEF